MSINNGLLEYIGRNKKSARRIYACIHTHSPLLDNKESAPRLTYSYINKTYIHTYAPRHLDVYIYLHIMYFLCLPVGIKDELSKQGSPRSITDRLSQEGAHLFVVVVGAKKESKMRSISITNCNY